MNSLESDLGQKLHDAIAELGDGMDVTSAKVAIFHALHEWFEKHPGVEDNTVNCIDCGEPTTRERSREVAHYSDAAAYACDRCCENRRQIVANSIG